MWKDAASQRIIDMPKVSSTMNPGLKKAAHTSSNKTKFKSKSGSKMAVEVSTKSNMAVIGEDFAEDADDSG